MTGAEEHRGAVPHRLAQAVREGVEGRQRALGIDHILAARVRGIARDPALISHQFDQVLRLPGPLGVKAYQNSRVVGREQPITPQTPLPRGGDDPRQPSRQQMRP